jgi:hypothetical protein
MMSFVNLLGDVIDVYRIEAIAGGSRTAYHTATVSLICHIMQLSPEKTVQYGGAVGKMYKLYLEADADVLDGDILIDQETEDRYQVKAGGLNVMDNIGSGNVQHIEVICTKLRKSLD